MSQADQPIEWYLARDGQQHGPISAAEMNKIIELGYLLPTDLVWRQGLADWQPASVAFPKKAAAPEPPSAPSPPSSSSSAAASRAPTIAPADKTSDGSKPTKEPERAAGRKAGAPVGGTRDPAARSGDAREIIAMEAARREEAARRAREQGRPSAGRPAPASGGHPGGPRQQMPGGQQHPRSEPQTRTEPHGRMDTRGGHPADAHPRETDARFEPDWGSDDEPRRRRMPSLLVASLLILLLVGGGGYALHATGRLDPLIATFSNPEPESATPVVQTAPGVRKRPAAVYSDDPAKVDEQFQQAAVWKLLKAEFPDWYNDRVRDTVRFKSEGKSDRDIAQSLAEQVVALRRKHVNDALAASPQHLKSVATTFLENLERLSKHSIDACYGFISQGETNPLIVELSRGSEHTPSLQRQTSAIFTAIAEGRRAPAKHRPPTREDYDQLAAQLAKRGWSPADLQLFSDARSLARAAPEKVCKMVQDWFAAQLAVSDEEVQVRLLMEALKPVVAG